MKKLDYQMVEDRSFKSNSKRPGTSGKETRPGTMGNMAHYSEDLLDIRSEKSQLEMNDHESFDMVANKSIMLEA